MPPPGEGLLQCLAVSCGHIGKEPVIEGLDVDAIQEVLAQFYIPARRENDGMLAGGCCHVWGACHHIAVVQLILGKCIQTNTDGGGIVQNIEGATAFEGSRGNVDCGEVAGI